MHAKAPIRVDLPILSGSKPIKKGSGLNPINTVVSAESMLKAAKGIKLLRSITIDLI